jgi:hypothetical protein
MIAGAVAGIATGIGGFFAAQKWLKWGGWRTSITSFLTAVVGGAATAGIVGRMGGSDIETKINTLNAQQASGMQQVHDAQSTVLLEYLKEVQAKALEAQKVEPTKAEEPAKAPGQTPAADAPTPAQETMSPPATITADPKDTTPAAQDTSAPASQSSAPEPSAVAPETKPSEGPATAPVTTEGKEQGIAPAPEGAEGESMAKKFAKEPAESKVAALAQQQAAQQSATAQI